PVVGYVSGPFSPQPEMMTTKALRKIEAKSFFSCSLFPILTYPLNFQDNPPNLPVRTEKALPSPALRAHLTAILPGTMPHNLRAKDPRTKSYHIGRSNSAPKTRQS
ncbi:MAG: hypothetical protein ACOC7K_00845, partial [bacterium]